MLFRYTVPTLFIAGILFSGCSFYKTGNTALWINSIEQQDNVWSKVTTSTPITSFLDMNADPEWKTIDLQPNLSATIPFSPSWTIDKLPITQFNTVPENETGKIIEFGRYSADRFTREYFIAINDKKSSTRLPNRQQVMTDTEILQALKKDAEEQCFGWNNSKNNVLPIEWKAPTIEKVENHEGIAYLVGGARGCSTRFSFVTNNYIIDVANVYPIGEDNTQHDITPEMRKIIGSITEKNN